MKKPTSIERKAQTRASARPERPAPKLPDDEEGERGRRDHRARNRDAVSVGERVRGAEQQHQRQHAEQQNAVHARDEDLAFLGVGGVDDLEPRQKTELDRLAGERIGAGDHRLARDDGGGGRQDDQRHQAPARRQEIEGICDRLRVVEDQRALAEIVADERRQDEEQPGRLDRPPAEMAHVGIERLRAR